MRTNVLYGVLTALFLILLSPCFGYCADNWQATTLVDHDLNAIWGSSDDDIYVAGDNGTFLSYDGTSWQESTWIQSNTPYDLMSVWGISPIVIITTDNFGNIFLNDSLRWVKYPSSNGLSLNAIWGTSATNAYAVGSNGTILFFNGSSWTNLTSSKLASPITITTGINLYCIWGSSANDVYAGGELGNLFHFNGSEWSSVNSGTSQDIRALWGSSTSDVYAAGSYGDILHYGGLTWKLAAASSGIRLNSLWGSGPNDVFAAGEYGAVYHYDGISWTKLGNTSLVDIYAVWGSTSGKVYFACKNGVMITYIRTDSISPVIYYDRIEGTGGKAYVSSPIEFSFTEKLDATTINSSTIIMTSGSTTVPAKLSLSPNGMAVSVSGADAFSTPYTITLTGGSNGIKDLAGNSMKSDYSVSFTTEDKPINEGSGSGGTCFISTAKI